MIQRANAPVELKSKTRRLTPYLHAIRTYLQSVTELPVEESLLLDELNLIDEALEAAKNDETVNDILKNSLVPTRNINVLGPRPGKCPVCGSDRSG